MHIKTNLSSQLDRRPFRNHVITGIAATMASLLASGCLDAPTEQAVGEATEAIEDGHVIVPYSANYSGPAEALAVLDAGCTASLIGPQWVITARHCAIPAGSHVVSRRPSGNVDQTVSAVYDSPDADISLLYLSQPFQDIRPVTLYAESPESVVGKEVTCYGYGAMARTTTCESSNPQCGPDEFCQYGFCQLVSHDLRYGDHLKIFSYDAAAALNAFWFDVPATTGHFLLPGDSGGPCFLNGELIATNGGSSYTDSAATIASVPSVRTWIAQTLNGSPGDTPIVGDFDSDGKKNDLGIWRPSNGTWYAKRSDNTILVNGIQYGMKGDIPLVGDFDSDGQEDDLGIWRPSTGTWYAKRTDGTIIFSGIQYGMQGDVPLVGDFDSDGRKDDLGIWRPSNGTWHAKRREDTVIFSDSQYGMQGDVPLVGDFDGDGRNDDLGIWRPSTGKWYAKRTDNTVIFQDVQWGLLGDVPLVGDYDGDGGKDDLGVWRPWTGTWHAKRSNDTVIVGSVQWGMLGDTPLVGDFDADGTQDDLGVWRPTEGSWFAARTNASVIFSGVQWGAPRW